MENLTQRSAFNERVLQVIQESRLGSGKVYVTFKPEAMAEVYKDLLTLERRSIISFDKDEWKVLSLKFSMKTGDWESRQSRTITITLGNKFDVDWFVSLLHKPLEDIEVVS